MRVRVIIDEAVKHSLGKDYTDNYLVGDAHGFIRLMMHELEDRTDRAIDFEDILLEIYEVDGEANEMASVSIEVEGQVFESQMIRDFAKRYVENSGADGQGASCQVFSNGFAMNGWIEFPEQNYS